MERTLFYNSIRKPLFHDKLSPRQFEGMEAILNACQSEAITDTRWIAYMLGTCLWETAQTMQPIEEYGRGKKYDYGKKLKMSRKPYTTPDKLYYGRGYVQLTWYENYDSLGKLLKIPLLQNPELALDPTIAAKIMIHGMVRGMFTGKSLKDCFHAGVTDWVNARKIINGLDKANEIAAYAQHFYAGLVKAGLTAY